MAQTLFFGTNICSSASLGLAPCCPCLLCNQLLALLCLPPYQVTFKCSVAVVQGHTALEGVLLFGKEHFYICECFVLSPLEEVYCTSHCLSRWAILSFLPEICLVSSSIGTWMPWICTDFEGISSRIIAQQEVCHPFHLFKKLFNITNRGACPQALEVPWEHPSSTDGDGGQSHTYIAAFQLCYSVVKVSFWVTHIFYSYGAVSTRPFSFIVS